MFGKLLLDSMNGYVILLGESRNANDQGEEDREFLEEEAGIVFAHWLKEKTAIPAAEASFPPRYLF